MARGLLPKAGTRATVALLRLDRYQGGVESFSSYAAWARPALGLGLGRSGHRSFYCHLISEQPHTYFTESVSPQLFRSQLRSITRRFAVMTVSEAAARAEAGESLHGTASLSTDDGLAENHRYFAPMCVDAGVRGTIFCVSDTIDNTSLMWRSKILHIDSVVDEGRVGQAMVRAAALTGAPNPQSDEPLREWSLRLPYPLLQSTVEALWSECGLGPVEEFLTKNQPYLTSAQLLELSQAGFEIGSHSRSHPVLPSLGAEDVIGEICDSVRALGAITGLPVVSFASPFGRRARREIETRAAAESGLRAMLGVRRSLNGSDPLVWERDSLEYGALPSMVNASIKPAVRRLQGRFRSEVSDGA